MKRTIDSINATIAKLFSDGKPTATIKTYGLAESVTVRGEDNITFPAMILPSGECLDVYGETDKRHVTLYHRLHDVSFQESDNGGAFGDKRGYKEADDMSLIVFGKRECIHPFAMEKIARKAIAETDGCILVSSNFDTLQVIASEYAGVSYFISPDYFVFKINYRITSTYNARCAINE